MAGIGQEVDLTIDSMFAADNDKNLLLRPAWRYDRNHGPSDGRDRILSHSSIDRFLSGTLRILTDDEFRQEQMLKNLEKESVDCFLSLFGTYPEWYRLENPYLHTYDEDECERCHVHLHMLNKAWNVCTKCNNELQEDQEQIWSLVIPSITPEQWGNSDRAGLAWGEERFFANGGAVQIEDNTVPDRIVNLDTGETTIIQHSGISVEEALADVDWVD